MLVLKRKIDEIITILPDTDADPSQTIDELFASGSIQIRLLGVEKNHVTVAIDAPPQLKIWRGERPAGETVVRVKKSA